MQLLVRFALKEETTPFWKVAAQKLSTADFANRKINR